MSEQPPRRALHQRSDSETNSQKLAPSSNSEGDSTVSPKAYAVSIWSFGTNSTQEQKSTKHKRTGTDSSNAGSTNTASRSNTIKSSKSAGSLYSLPPVPPLRIYKDRETMPGAASTAQSVTVGYTGGEITQPAPAFSYGPSILPADLPSPPLSGGGAPPLRPLPRSILKQPSSEYSFADYYEHSVSSYRLPTPPPTTNSEEYRRKSSTWVGASAQQDATPSRARMNEQSLRMVGANDEVSITTEESYEEDSVIPGGLGVRSGIKPVAESRTNSRRISQAGSMEENVQISKGLPTWTSYFYGRGSTPNSAGEAAIPQEKSDEDVGYNMIGRAVTSMTPSPDPHTQVRMSPDVVEIPSRATIRTPEPDARTAWSAPHLDYTRFGRLEAMNGNRQVILFCLGFILPICWFVAAFLPLPQPPTTRHSRDLEATIAQDLYTTRTTQVYLEQRWRNSRFWRRVNRVLSAVGSLIIIAIIILAVVASTTGA